MLGSGDHPRLCLCLDCLLNLPRQSLRASQGGEESDEWIHLNSRTRRPLIRHPPSCRRDIARGTVTRTPRIPSLSFHAFPLPSTFALERGGNKATCRRLRLQARVPTPEAREIGAPATTPLTPCAEALIVQRHRSNIIGTTSETSSHDQRSVSPHPYLLN